MTIASQIKTAVTGRKTVASVMAAFTTTMSELDTVAENNEQIAANLQIEQERIAADMKAARDEAESARKIRAKLADIVA